MAITFAQFRYFCELADVGNFGRAAERLHMSQPPLSRQIALMESELGTDLFERGPKGVTLTAAGRLLLIDAREVLRVAALAENNVKAARTGEAGELSLGFTMCAAYSVIPALTRLYKEAFPNVQLRVKELMPTVLEQALREGDIDVGISFPGLDSGGTRSQQLIREPMNAVLPFNHRLARARRLRVEDLAEENFIIVPRDQAPVLHDSVITRCQSAGFTPRIGLEVYLQQTIVHLVAEGLGVAFVPMSMKSGRVDGAVFKAIDDTPFIEQHVVWQRRNLNPCVQRFLEICLQFARTRNV